MSTIVFEIVKLIVMVGAAAFAAAWAVTRERHGAKVDEFITWAEKAVLWAQQVYWAETGEARKSVAMEFLKVIRNRYKVNISDEQISVLIEAAVKELNDKEGFGYIYLQDAETEER